MFVLVINNAGPTSVVPSNGLLLDLEKCLYIQRKEVGCPRGSRWVDLQQLRRDCGQGRSDFCTPEVKGQFCWPHLYCWGLRLLHPELAIDKRSILKEHGVRHPLVALLYSFLSAILSPHTSKRGQPALSSE